MLPEDISEIPANTLLVFDDLMMDSFNKEITDNKISTILVLHNLFHQSKYSRNITLNAQYIVYFKNPRDLSSASILARQLCPSNWRNLQNLFNEATHKPYSYLIVDLTQNTPELFKYRNNIFNEYFNCYATNEVIEKNQEIQGHAIDLGQ